MSLSDLAKHSVTRSIARGLSATVEVLAFFYCTEFSRRSRHCDSAMLIRGMWRKRHVDERSRFAGYLLCVIIVLETATVEMTSGTESVGSDDQESSAAVAQPVRRHAFSVTHDLATLTKMLSDESQRRRMQEAEAFFDTLHKRRQPLKQPLFAVSSPNVESPAKKMNVKHSITTP